MLSDNAIVDRRFPFVRVNLNFKGLFLRGSIHEWDYLPSDVILSTVIKSAVEVYAVTVF